MRQPPLEELRADVRYRRERLQLHRAKTYGGRRRDDSRMHELERELAGAEDRLRAAERKA